MQGGGNPGLKGPSTSPQGDPIQVEVSAPGATKLLVTVAGSGNAPKPFPVLPGGSVLIPAQPEWPAGTVLIIMTNNAPVKAIAVEIVPQSE